MKAIIINGYTTDLSREIGILIYPGRRVVHLVLPDEGLRITPFWGQLLISTEIDQLLECYRKPNNPRGYYTGEEIVLGERFANNIRRLLRVKSQLENRLAGETSRLAKHFAEPLNRHKPTSSTD